jgi:hypothetical protein
VKTGSLILLGVNGRDGWRRLRVKRWCVVFGGLLGVLLLRNLFLFSTLIHETGDTGANSIIISQAKHFELLVGNYSRQGFNHPGPGYFYVQAAGEWLFHDLLGLVPTPWNGQVMALYVLNAAFLATIVHLIARLTGSWFTATTALLAIMLLIAFQPQIINNPWMPYLYVPTFLLLLVASASVAAGHGEHLWAATLSAGLLIHGHAVFLLFAPAVLGTALILAHLREGLWTAAVPRPARLPAGLNQAAPELEPAPAALTAGGTPLTRAAWPFRRWLGRSPLSKRDLMLSGGIAALFLLPIVLNTVLHWPGEFAKYIGYGSDSRTGDGRSIVDAAGYAYWFLWPLKHAWPGLLVLGVAGWALARRRHPFTRAGLILGALVIGLLVFYAYVAIDHLNDPYMGFFAWAVPLLLVIALVIWAGERFSGKHFSLPLAGALAVMLIVPGFRTITNDDQPAVPVVVRAFAAQAGGRPIVLDVGDDIGPETPGLLLWARRTAIPMCLSEARWSHIVTGEFVCTAAETTTGLVITRIRVYPDTPLQPGEIARTGASAFVTQAPVEPVKLG